jgi:hypothetical protein
LQLPNPWYKKNEKTQVLYARRDATFTELKFFSSYR